MSNEYKDWKKDRIEEEEIILKKYPFLRARDKEGNFSTDSDFPLMTLEIPEGWLKLFFQMCDDIKVVLEKYNKLDKFYFLQVKEKFNIFRCFYGCAAPKEIDIIVDKYENMAPYVCTKCGAPAYAKTKDHIASYCMNCWKDSYRHANVEFIKFKDYYREYNFGMKEEKTISFREEWNRLYREE